MAQERSQNTKPIRVALDTNAVAQLCESNALSRAARLILRRLVKADRVRVVVGYPVVAELAVLAGSNLSSYRHQMRELEELTRGRLLLRWVDRVKREVSLRSRLVERTALMPRGSSTQFFRDAFDDIAGTAREASKVKRAKQEFERVMRSAKAALTEEARMDVTLQDDVHKWRKRFRTCPDTTIDEMFAIVLREQSTFFGYTGGAESLPSPHEVPTLRADVAFHVAYHYVASVDGLGPGRFEGSDFFDNMVFNDAVYADTLVTDDARFRKIAAATGTNPNGTLESFASWARRLCNP